jgi:penicillin amidase
VLRRLILANARVDDTAVRFDAAAAARLAELGKAAVAFVGRPASAPGSNAWAIEGWRSATGHPLLCNDPHLPLLAPSMLLLQHLEAPGVKVAGLGGPGIPGIAMGHNAHCAWGVTHAFVDDCDVFAEQLDGERCATPAGPVELRTRTVHIMVRDAVVEQRVIRYSPHGPLLSDLIARRDDLPPSYALRWSGRDGSRDLEGFWAMARAESWTDFRGAAALLGTPAWNLVYADRQHIGYCLAGAVPRRPWGGSLEIVDGARHGDWQGYVPAAELPHLLDPEDGIVASANDRVVDEGYPHYISDLFEPPFRVRRIRQLLTATPLHDVEQMRRVQLDDFSEWAFRINRERLQPLAADVRDADAQFALRVLSSWDGRLRVDYVAPSVFHAFLLAFARRVLAAALGSDLADLTLSQVEMPALPLEKIMARDPEAWLGEPGGEGEVAALIEAALADAVQQLRALAGPRPGAWTWGALHQVTHRHLLDDGTALRHLSIGPTPSAGDWSTLNLGLYRPSEPFASIVGADARLIVDLADFDRSRWVLSTGQSGNPLSPCYRDQASLMARGLDRAWPFSRGAIEAAASRRIQADPAVRGEAATRS